MKTLTILLPLLGIGVGSTPVQAAGTGQSGESATYQRCMDTGDAARGVTVAIMDCLGAEISRQDAALNQAYKSAMLKLPQASRARLRASERDWIKRRDARCRSAGDEVEGGSLSGILYNQCLLDETLARTRWLKSHAAGT